MLLDVISVWYVITVFRLLTDFVCLYNYEFWLSLCKIVRSSVILLLPLLWLIYTICSNLFLLNPANYFQIYVTSQESEQSSTSVFRIINFPLFLRLFIVYFFSFLLFTLPEHPISPPVFSEVRGTRSLVLCVCFVDRNLSFCALFCLFFLELRILITPSSNSSSYYLQSSRLFTSFNNVHVHVHGNGYYFSFKTLWIFFLKPDTYITSYPS